MTDAELLEENRRLRERLGPRGLEVVEIDGAGHYVNEKVKAEIEVLRHAIQMASRLANAIDEMAINPKGGKMASIAYHNCARLIRDKIVRNTPTDSGQEVEHLRGLLRRAASYGGIEPQLDIEIRAALERR